ncbi:MAG: 16S rRNA (cytosine(967)-C(5))-methyltransferase RsmB [Clostridia bacterium]|nr:16S rRNA (cytosine(967)-C(5))-methyltransferase RsmB [Clostridia bacterium]
MVLEVLRDVDQDGAYAGLALNERLSKARLKPEDRRLATAIVYGVLENQIQIDFALDRLMSKPAYDPLQRAILRLSACQILFHSRVPDSAAVNEGVSLAKAVGMEGAAGFINAVLRSLTRTKGEIPWPKEKDGLREFLHVMGSAPLWIVDRLLAAYGEEDARRMILHRNTGHPVVVRPNMLRLTDAQFEDLLRRKGWQSSRGLAPHAYLLSGAAELALDGDYQRGMFSIQGQSSILAAEAVQAKPGMRILDACAAPGGKSAYLCEVMQGTGRVYAWELHEKRAILLESAKRRLGLENLRISVRDAAIPKQDLYATLDAVLLDAPCSGLGVMAQKPDIKHRIQPEDMGPITEAQRKLLDALSPYVKPGGLLVYSTCSVLPEENGAQVNRFLRDHPEFSAEALPSGFPKALRDRQDALGIQLLGCRDDVEGFYIARLRKGRT